MLNTPVLVRSLKLSNIEPSQYLDGWPPGNTGCCWLHNLLANFPILSHFIFFCLVSWCVLVLDVNKLVERFHFERFDDISRCKRNYLQELFKYEAASTVGSSKTSLSLNWWLSYTEIFSKRRKICSWLNESLELLIRMRNSSRPMQTAWNSHWIATKVDCVRTAFWNDSAWQKVYLGTAKTCNRPWNVELVVDSCSKQSCQANF